MVKKHLIPAVLSGLLLVAPAAFAEQTHHPEAASGTKTSPAETAEGAATAAPVASGGMAMGGRAGCLACA